MTKKMKKPDGLEHMDLILTEADAVRCLEKLDHAGVVGFDSESSGPLEILKGGRGTKRAMLNTYRSTLTGVSVSADDQLGWYMPISHVEGNSSIRAQRKLYDGLDHQSVVTAHNLKHELLALSRDANATWLQHFWNEELRLGTRRLVCTQVLSWIAGRDADGKYGLKGLMKHFHDQDRPDFKDTTQGRQFSELHPLEGLEYAVQDALDAARLYLDAPPSSLPPKLQSWFWDVEMPTVAVLRHMEDAGMYVCPEKSEEVSADLLERKEALKSEWDFETEHSIASPAQLQNLYAEGIWSKKVVARTATGSYAVDKTAVAAQIAACKPGSLGHTLALLKQRYTALNTLYGGYGPKLIQLAGQYDDLRLHSSFNQTGTRTGRYASSYPNTQQIPTRSADGKKIREVFVAESGRVLLSADYSQIELRVLAHLAGSGTLFDGFHAGIDPHQATGDALGVDRNGGKTGNFAIIYNAGARKVAQSLGITLPQAKAFLVTMEQNLAEEYAALNKRQQNARVRGKTATLSGRTRRIESKMWADRLEALKDAGERYNTSEEYREAWYRLGKEDRRARNTPVQGSAADIVKKAMLDMYRQLDLSRTSIIAQVHDDILQEPEEGYADEAAEIQERCMVNAWDLKVPLQADVTRGSSWAELKE